MPATTPCHVETYVSCGGSMCSLIFGSNWVFSGEAPALWGLFASDEYILNSGKNY